LISPKLVKEELKMADLVNPTVLSTGGLMGSGYGNNGGLMGGDGIGSLLIGALLFGGGLGGGFGGRNGLAATAGDTVTTAHLQSALNQQTQSQNTNNILQSLATIQQLIPENEGRVQAAIAGAQIALGNQASQGQLAAANQASQGQLQVAASTALLTNNVADARHNINDNIHAGVLSQLAGQAAITAGVVEARKDINDNIHLGRSEAANGFSSASLQAANYSAATQLGIANLGLQTAQQTSVLTDQIRDDGDKTRSLIVAQYEANLQRLLTTAQNEIIELRGDRNMREAHRGTEVTVSQNVSQASAQAQQQQQQQQQFAILSQIAASLSGLTQIAHATNQNVISGNSGAVQTGPQNANPTNVA
jgi:hypothetical protein